MKHVKFPAVVVEGNVCGWELPSSSKQNSYLGCGVKGNSDEQNDR